MNDVTEKRADLGRAAEDALDRAEVGTNLRELVGWQNIFLFWFCVLFTSVHLFILNVHPVDPWLFRSGHVAFGSAIGFMMFGFRQGRQATTVPWYDVVAMALAIASFVYIYVNLDGLLFRAGAAPTGWDVVVGLIGTALILELTRRSAGLALPVIAIMFLLYCFVGPWMPGVLYHKGIPLDHTFSFIYSMEGIFGPTTAVSSTYIILFITFAGFLQASKVGEYFINFSFAIAGRARGGPAKVAVMSSALMGMINGTSAGNVAATGTFTIPMMKKVGYRPQSAAAIEAAASTGGQIMPPVMGAGAFIMAEITGIPYTDLMIAATIPAALYFLAVYFMVDNEALRMNMRGLPGHELPALPEMLKRVFLFLPLIILIGGLVSGYSVIRSGTLAMASAFMVSWLVPEARMGFRSVCDALHLGAKGTIQLIAVCACAGIIVGVIGLTGIGLRFSSMILSIAGENQLAAMFFAMAISIILGMGMPTTAAYAVAASVVAPGLIKLGISPLVAHMFVFYYAVISAITPPVALAAYAGAALAGSDPMRTSVTAFIYGLAAFIVPFMFFYSPALLMQGDWVQIVHYTATACIGVYVLAAALQGWYFGLIGLPLRLVLFACALLLIYGGLWTDIAGLVPAGLLAAWQLMRRRSDA